MTHDGGSGGPNFRQNFPVITAVGSQGGSHISGTLNSVAITSFTIEFFSSATGDPSGNGEGRTFLGSTTVTTDGSGNASFFVTFAATAPPGEVVTATATRSVAVAR